MSILGNLFGSTMENLRNNPLTIKGTEILNNTKNKLNNTKNKLKMDLIDKTSRQLENLKNNPLIIKGTRLVSDVKKRAKNMIGWFSSETLTLTPENVREEIKKMKEKFIKKNDITMDIDCLLKNQYVVIKAIPPSTTDFMTGEKTQKPPVNTYIYKQYKQDDNSRPNISYSIGFDTIDYLTEPNVNFDVLVAISVRENYRLRMAAAGRYDRMGLDEAPVMENTCPAPAPAPAAAGSKRRSYSKKYINKSVRRVRTAKRYMKTRKYKYRKL